MVPGRFRATDLSHRRAFSMVGIIFMGPQSRNQLHVLTRQSERQQQVKLPICKYPEAPTTCLVGPKVRQVECGGGLRQMDGEENRGGS